MISAFAADISLLDDGKLTGELTSMDGRGTITLISPLSGQPLLLNSENVKQVDFGLLSSSAKIPDHRVHLINGDILPVSVDTLTGQLLHTSSQSFGQMDIPRNLVDSFQLGIFPETVVYVASKDFSGWKRDKSGSRNWELEGSAFLANGPGTLSRELKLPEKFVIRFSLSWNTHPNFRLSFADPLEKQGSRADRYFLQFAGAGLEIKRESSGDNRFVPIVMLSRPPEQFPNNKLDVEIRVDRSNGQIHLYLDGELEGRYADPISNIPAGNGISLISQAPAESEQKIRFLEICEWDDRGDRHRTEERGDDKADSLIGRNGERFSGVLQEVRADPTGRVYIFRSDFQPLPIEVPEAEVSTIFMAKGDGNAPSNQDQSLILHLRGSGEIHVSSCEFGKETVIANHPLLGPIELQRSAITKLERRVTPKPVNVESQ